MIKILVGVALVSVALCVYFLGQNALFIVVGVGAGMLFAEVLDFGAGFEANEDDAPRGRQ